MDVAIEQSWKQSLAEEFKQLYFGELVTKVKREYQQGPVFPEPQNIFRAFDMVPFEQVKVVILGQDPYHTPGVADGLSFSSKPGNRVPPSLKNIYKEIASEFGYESYEYINNPDLTRWAEQGVLLLNNALTVRSGQANSHKEFGWGTFTNKVIQVLAKQREGLVFILWGKFAMGKKPVILEQSTSHLILESAHPSPFSADKGFFGNGHFKTCNEWLENLGRAPVKW